MSPPLRPSSLSLFLFPLPSSAAAVIAAFSEGATSEEIVQQYPSLTLADVYSVIGYYLRRAPEVEIYLRHRKAQEQAVRQQNELRFDPDGLRDRLLARRARQG